MRQFELENKTTRDAFGAAVLELAKEDPTVIGIGADTTSNLGMKQMAKEMPNRVYNVGIAEQNMMGIAAGMAATGFRVFGGSFAPFICMRSLEQFRTFIAYPHLNVVMAGGMGGLGAANEGVTHQCPEDVAIMRTIAGNVVVAPADTASTRAVVLALGRHDGPAYVRLGKTAFHKVFDVFLEFIRRIERGTYVRGPENAGIYAGRPLTRAFPINIHHNAAVGGFHFTGAAGRGHLNILILFNGNGRSVHHEENQQEENHVDHGGHIHFPIFFFRRYISFFLTHKLHFVEVFRPGSD